MLKESNGIVQLTCVIDWNPRQKLRSSSEPLKKIKELWENPLGGESVMN